MQILFSGRETLQKGLIQLTQAAIAANKNDIPTPADAGQQIATHAAAVMEDVFESASPSAASSEAIKWTPVIELLKSTPNPAAIFRTVKDALEHASRQFIGAFENQVEAGVPEVRQAITRNISIDEFIAQNQSFFGVTRNAIQIRNSLKNENLHTMRDVEENLTKRKLSRLPNIGTGKIGQKFIALCEMNGIKLKEY